jgi:hypothetical protein
VTGIRLRAPHAQDWPAIGRVADASLPWQPVGNREWLHNRMNFDERALQRRHHVAEDAGAMCGYGSVEGGQVSGRYRLFVVTDAKVLSSVGEILMARLDQDLVELRCEVAWVREEARDVELLNFFRRHGFVDAAEFTTETGLRVVTLERHV